MRVLDRSLLCAAMAIAMTNSACSFLFVHGSPPAPAKLAQTPAPVIHCTTSNAAPILDTVFTTLELIRTGIAIGASDSAYTNLPFNRGVDIGLGVGFTALFLSSAVYGFNKTSSCAEAVREAEAARASNADADEEPASKSSARPRAARGAAGQGEDAAPVTP